MVVAAVLLIVPRLTPDAWAGRPFFQLRFRLTATTGAVLVLALLVVDAIRPAVIYADLEIPPMMVAPQRILTLLFWTLVVLAAVSSLPWLKQHMVAATVVASVCIVFGMWLERWIIIVPTLSHPLLIEWARYTPTLTEWSLTIASFALFVLLLMVFFKLFPPVSIWEVAEGRILEKARSVVEIPLPERTPTPASAKRWNALAVSLGAAKMPSATQRAGTRAAVYSALAEALVEPQDQLVDVLITASARGTWDLGSRTCERTLEALTALLPMDLGVLLDQYRRTMNPAGRRPPALYESLHRHGHLMGEASTRCRALVSSAGRRACPRRTARPCRRRVGFFGRSRRRRGRMYRNRA